MPFPAKRIPYSYTLRSAGGGRTIKQDEVTFEYEIADDGDGPRIDVTAVYMEGDTDLLTQPGWRRQYGLDIADQIQSDVMFCRDLLEE
jgi:hypothetical protein